MSFNLFQMFVLKTNNSSVTGGLIDIGEVGRHHSHVGVLHSSLCLYWLAYLNASLWEYHWKNQHPVSTSYYIFCIIMFHLIITSSFNFLNLISFPLLFLDCYRELATIQMLLNITANDTNVSCVSNPSEIFER